MAWNRLMEKGNIVLIHKKARQTNRSPPQFGALSIQQICKFLWSFHQANLILHHIISVSISYSPSFIRYVDLFMKVLKVSDLISQKNLIRCGVMVSFLFMLSEKHSRERTKLYTCFCCCYFFFFFLLVTCYRTCLLQRSLATCCKLCTLLEKSAENRNQC